MSSPSSEGGTLVVGAAQAGIQLASSLRELGYDEAITLVGAEERLPYHRPPLSKAFLTGTATEESLTIRGENFFEAQRITMLRDDSVAEILPGGEAVTAGGRRLGFARLALTTGAHPRSLSIPGTGLSGVRALRDLQDALALRDGIDRAERIVVVGGGFIGLEVAATARKLGKHVTVVLLDRRLMARAVGVPTSQFFADAHTRRGVALHLGVMPTTFLDDGDGNVAGVVLDDGTTLPADLVVVGIGVSPRTELAVQLGLTVDNGIVVDEFGLTSDGSTVAAGDCVSCPDPMGLSAGRLRFESVNTAIEQAKTAASTIVGSPKPYRTPPWFWSDQFDIKLQVAGLSAEHDQIVLRGDQSAEKFSVLYYREDRLIAAECINRAADFVAVRSALATGRSAPAERVCDATVPLKTLLQDSPESPARSA